jgi:CBS domain-containing protein
MTPSPSTCTLDDSANDAAHIMWERDCGAVPIVDRAGCVKGIVTDRDICMAAHFQGVPLSRISIATIMSRHLCTVRPDDDLSRAERVMRDHQIRRLPVVDESGCVIGMLSFSDVTRGVSRNGGVKERDGQEALQTIAAISEPRDPHRAST